MVYEYEVVTCATNNNLVEKKEKKGEKNLARMKSPYYLGSLYYLILGAEIQSLK